MAFYDPVSEMRKALSEASMEGLVNLFMGEALPSGVNEGLVFEFANSTAVIPWKTRFFRIQWLVRFSIGRTVEKILTSTAGRWFSPEDLTVHHGIIGALPIRWKP